MSQLVIDYAHGTLVGYRYHKCRCEPCTAIATKAHREWRQANPEKARESEYRSRAANPAATRATMQRTDISRNAKFRAVLDEIRLAAGCADCGYREHPRALQFDHVRGEKLFDISAGNHKSKAALEVELAKCEVVCANCHSIRTDNRRASPWSR